MMKNNLKYVFIFICFSIFPLVAAVTFYSNPENINQYKKYGLYSENKFVKKILLSNNWRVRVEGGGDWENVFVPSAYNNYGSDKKVFYKTSFYIGGNLSQKRNYKLVFYGVNHSCNVKINGNFIENHNSGYNSFETNLNNNLLKFNGKNELEIEVENNIETSETIPVKMLTKGWRNYGGIFRDVFLVVTSNVNIDDVNLDYSLNKDYSSCKMGITATIRDNEFIKVDTTSTVLSDKKYFSRIEITQNRKIVYKSESKDFLIHNYSKQEMFFSFDLPNPLLWSPQTPHLYKCSVILSKTNRYGKLEDFNQYDFNFGIKDLKIEDGNFILNGKEFKLKGISRFEDIAGMGNAVTYSRMNSDIEKIKNLNVNFLRCKYTPPHPYLLDLCDKYGIFVSVEIPIVAVPNEIILNHDFINIAKNNLKEIIDRDKKHVSVFAWGVGSKYNVFDLKIVDFIKDLSDYAHELTDNIFTFYELPYTDLKEYYKLTDFNVINLPRNDEIKDKTLLNIKKTASNQPIIIDNIGQTVVIGNKNGFSDSKSEPAQAKYIIENIKRVNSYNNIDGVIIDSFMDHKSETPLLTTIGSQNRYIVSDGLVAYNRAADGKDRCRISYRTVESIFKGGKIPSLMKGDYKKKILNLYFYLGFMLLLLFAYMSKREHYFRLNMLRSFNNPDAFFIDIRDRRLTQTWQPLFIGTITSIGIASSFSTIFFYLKDNPKFDYFLSIFIQNRALKSYAIECARNPYLFIFITLIVIETILLLSVLYIKIFSLILNIRYSFSTAISMVFWNSQIFLWTIPFSILFLRIISQTVINLYLILIIISTIWFIYRFFHLMAVSFKFSLNRVFWINILVVLSFLFIIIYILNIQFNDFDYFKYYWDVISNIN